MHKRGKVLTLALLGTLLLAGGCVGGPGLTLDTAGDGGGPLPTVEAGVTTKAAPKFNPFGNTSSADGGREVIQNPSLEEILKPGPLPEMALGRADAPVTVVQYASMTCPICKRFLAETFPTFKREYIDTGKVRFILRAEFPIGRQSGLATIALRCAPPARYFALYEKFMQQQASWVSQEVRPDPIFKVAAQVGLTRAQFDTCRENQGMIAAINGIKDRGRTLGVIGTPNFFVDGKLVKSFISVAEMRTLLDQALAKRSATASR